MWAHESVVALPRIRRERGLTRCALVALQHIFSRGWQLMLLSELFWCCTKSCAGVAAELTGGMPATCRELEQRAMKEQ